MARALRISLRRLSAVLLLALLLISRHSASAAEPTEAEGMYQRLQEAETHADRLLGDRWNKLVRQRQWVDASGKFKTYARYVDHDENLQSVKLLILVKNGAEPAYKEATIPLAKLSKSDQAIVKRIAIMRKQVEKALADAPAADELSRGEMALGEGTPYDRAEISTEPAAEVPPPPAELAAMATIEPWRTDFASFSNNLSAQQDEQGRWAVTWTGLPAFDAVYQQEQVIHQLNSISAGGQFPTAALEAAVRERSPAAPPQPDIETAAVEQQAAFPNQGPATAATDTAISVPRSTMFMLGAKYGWSRSGLGQVSWETTTQAVPTAPGEPLQHDLQLSPPLTIELIPETSSAAEFAKLQPGQRIRFIGSFERLGGFDDPPKIVLKVRPVAQTTSGPAADGTRGRAP